MRLWGGQITRDEIEECSCMNHVDCEEKKCRSELKQPVPQRQDCTHSARALLSGNQSVMLIVYIAVGAAAAVLLLCIVLVVVLCPGGECTPPTHLLICNARESEG